MKKLLSQIKKLFTSKRKFDSPGVAGNEEFLQALQEKNQKQLEQQPTQKTVDIDFATGKILNPQDLSPEEAAEIEEAMKEIQKLLGDNASFQSFEDFLKEGGASGGGFTVPFTTANNLPEAQLQVFEEMENHKFDTQNWSEVDYLEHLYSYVNQNYEFDGLEQMYNKYTSGVGLTEEEKVKLEQWYTLVSQELVYEV